MADSSEIKVNPDPNIPDALFFAEILPKLPLKSLMRFKCVAKSWKSTISSPKFAKLLLQLSNSGPHDHGVLIQSSSSLYAIPNYASYDGNDNFAFEPLRMRFDHHGFIDGSFDVMGSCNGLICFRFERNDDLCVWNPITEECRRIPGFQNEYVMIEPSLWAFGYIPSLDDYKIVNTCFMFDENSDDKCGTFTRVFSLRNDVWKEYETIGPLGQYSCRTTSNSGVVLVNAKCHWLLVWQTNFFSFPSVHILVFDLVTETFDTMLLPQDLDGEEMRDLREYACIGVIDEDLCVATQGYGQCLEVWVMEHNGEGESWTKLLKVSGLTTPSTGDINFCALCGYRKGGLLLMHLNEEVWVYYWNDSNPECVRMLGVLTHNTRQYVPSLISPFMMEDAEDQ